MSGPPEPQRRTARTRTGQPLELIDLPAQDVRRKRPPVLSFFLRLETLRRLLRVLILMAIDFAGVYLAIFTALALKAAVRHGFAFDAVVSGTNRIFPFAYLVTALLFARSGLYADRPRRPGFARIVTSLFQVTVVALIFAVVSGEQFSTYYLFYSSLGLAIVYIGTGRLMFDRASGALLRAAGYRRRALIVGTGAHIEAVAGALAGPGPAPIEPVGFLAIEPQPQAGLRSLGTLDRLDDVLEHETVDEVIIADPDFPQERAVDLVDRCHRRGIRVSVVPSTMEILVGSAEFVPGQPVPLFELKPPVFEGIDFALKRTFDLVGATVLLLLLSPILLVITLAVRLSSRGPVLFRSVRPGIGGVPFACLKFRTMRMGAEELQPELEQSNEADGALFKIKDDPRLTGVGRLLRRFSLDELPQLVNVLRGEMSLVGPRPLPMRDFERLEPWHRKRYLVLPGVTGLWQVSGRSNLDFDDLVRLDFLYLERWSVALDLTILLKTIPAVFTRRGAY